MKLAASNIAWGPSDDDAVSAVLRQHGFSGVEIAPSKRWEAPAEAPPREVAEYRAAWEHRGLQIVAMQALLYGRPDLQLFGSLSVRRGLRDYLAALVDLASGLGAGALVFGSPKNRRRGSLPFHEATAIAVEFFREVGAVAASRGCIICIEPNPPEYDCDFINTTAEAVTLCEQIGHHGVRVNGDAGAMAINGEDPLATVTNAVKWFGHFHASEPSLVEVGGGNIQEECAIALSRQHYGGWISIEMRISPDSQPVEAVSRAARHIARLYGKSISRS
jgi:D-psicose/D-tagatose/L-ribulose 3-epimerase